MRAVSLYDRHYYSNQKEGSLASARVIVPIVMELVRPRSVIDIGCGVGTWLKIFSDMGISHITGIDGPWINSEQLCIPKERFHPSNLECLELHEKADLAVCLEVGEHLPLSTAPRLIQALTTIAPVVLFSAAIPLQGGTNHINEQWPQFWAELFNARGYLPVDAIRRRIWNNENVEFWYAQNILLYVKKEKLSHYEALAAEIEKGYGQALPLVHPKKYLYVAERYRLLEPWIKLLPGSLLRGGKRLLSSLLHKRFLK